MNASSVRTLPSSAPTPVGAPKQIISAFSREGPSQRELVLLWLISGIFFIIVLTHFESYSARVITFGDNRDYISAAHAIRLSDFRSTQTRQGWGLPYLIALLSTLHLSERISLILISMAASLASVLLVRSLWGPWIAAFFAILNFPWIQASFLGSSEPLFVFLLFGSFWFSRKERPNERWIVSSALAALATVTRAIGIFSLGALGLTLLLRKEYRKLALSIAVASLIGTLYLLPFWMTFHDPLYQIHRRASVGDWDSGHLLTWPFRTIVISYLYYTGPWTNVILTGGWIALATAGLFRMGWKWYREGLPQHPYEQIFAITYLMFLFSYNSLEWARWDFHRFVIPAIPMLLFAFDGWLPKSRYIIYPICAVSSMLAACSAIGIQNVLSTFR